MKTIREIDTEIRKLEEKLESVEGRPTEVYTRIVGYYRSLRNWNRGKREEYSERVLFDLESAPANLPLAAAAEVETEATAVIDPVYGGRLERYIYFFRETCPNCPPVRTLLEDLEIPGSEMDVDTEEGTRGALEYGIYTTPTVIFFDSTGEEVCRASSTGELSGLKIPQMA